MSSTPEDAGSDEVDVDTRSFYLGDRGSPALYVAIRPGEDPGLAEVARVLVRFAQAFGLPPLEVSGSGRLRIAPALEGWRLVLAELDHEAGPLVSIDWPAVPSPLVYGVRRTSLAGWPLDAVGAGRVVLMIGPPLDWDAMVIRLEARDDSGIMDVGRLMQALGGREAACGVVPAVALAA
ncbi:hypothetical protein [Nonomuraea sp. NPDC049646]|uniref:hypothetical protein n=1 Tax=unclassified Nonomuraea TaxID=2593643 RepID=UPI0037AB7A74